MEYYHLMEYGAISYRIILSVVVRFSSTSYTIPSTALWDVWRVVLERIRSGHDWILVENNDSATSNELRLRECNSQYMFQTEQNSMENHWIKNERQYTGTGWEPSTYSLMNFNPIRGGNRFRVLLKIVSHPESDFVILLGNSHK